MTSIGKFEKIGKTAEFGILNANKKASIQSNACTYIIGSVNTDD